MSLINEVIATVQPQNKKSSSKIPLLTTFENIHTSESKLNTVGSIPIYKDKLHLVKGNQTQGSDSKKEADDDIVEDGEGENDNEYKLKYFVELKRFKTDVLAEQLFELAVLGFQSLDNSAVEQILNVLINDDADEGHHLNFTWSEVDDVDRKFVYLRLDKTQSEKNSEKIVQLIKLEGVKILESDVKFIAEQNTIDFINDSLGKDYEPKAVDINNVEEKALKIIETNKKNKKVSNDLDYVIDETELKDIRPEDLSQLKIDIKGFRLKVLENEKKKRQKEALEEVKRSKLQLRQLFVKFQKESDSSFDQIEVDEDESDEEDEDAGLTDEQYEQLRKAERNSETLKKYVAKLTDIRKEERRNDELIRELKELEGYENSLDQNIKNGYETGDGFRPSNRDKLSELQRDDQDRENEKIEAKVLNESEIFLKSINIPLKASLNQEVDEEQEEEEPEEDIETTIEEATEQGDKLLISDDAIDQVLEKIKPSIESYIEEYLGVKEDELLEYILMIIKDTKSHNSLVDELKETFDDDAVAIAEKIWKDVLKNL